MLYKVCSSFVYQTVAIGLTQPWRVSQSQDFARAQTAFERSWGKTSEYIAIPFLHDLELRIPSLRNFRMMGRR